MFNAELTDSAHPTKLLSYIFVNIVHEWQKSGKRHMVRSLKGLVDNMVEIEKFEFSFRKVAVKFAA